jgi:hypothetical protein
LAFYATPGQANYEALPEIDVSGDQHLALRGMSLRVTDGRRRKREPSV